MTDPGAECLGPSIDGADAHRGTDRQTCRFRRGCGDAADHLTRPGQPGHRHPVHDRFDPRLVPAGGGHVVHRVTLAGGVVIEDVFAGQAGHHEGVRVVPAGAGRPDLRLVALHPANLRANGLSRQGGAAPGEDLFRTELIGELLDLGGGPTIDPVQDGRASRVEVLVAEQQARADTADAQSADGRPAATVGTEVRGGGREFSAHLDEVLPPHDLGIDLGPGRTRQAHSMGPHRGGENLAGCRGEDALRATGAHVDTDEVVSHGLISHLQRSAQQLILTTGLRLSGLGATRMSGTRAECERGREPSRGSNGQVNGGARPVPACGPRIAHLWRPS